jgi:hypothetical protein
MSEYEFQELDDEELRERVLDALDPIERRLKAGRRPGTSTSMLSADKSRNTVGEAVYDLRELFGGDEIDLDGVDEDEKGVI